MPATPATWLGSTTVNAPALPGDIFADPQIVALTNGNVLVAWSTNSTDSPADPAGTDIVGQIFDKLGNKVGSEIRLNDSYTVDDEFGPSITATSGGGFIVAYSDIDAGVVSIRLDEYNDGGLVISSNPTVANDTLAATPNFSSPAIAAASDTSAMVVYEKEVGPGDVDIYFKVYNPATNTYGSEIAMMISADSFGTPSITVLSNGNYAVAADLDKFTSNSSIVVTIRDSAGALVKSPVVVATTHLNANQDSDPAITALTGGGFVVSWTSDVTGSGGANSDVMFQVFDAAGNEVGTAQTVNGTGVNANNDQSTVVALDDGGFIVIYDNDENFNQITAQRYDASGNTVGSEFDIDASGPNTEPQAALMADGRVAVTFWANDSIQLKIIDPRDTVSLLGVTPSDYVVGTIGDDTLIMQSVTSTQTYGWDGDDTIGIDGFIGFGDIFDGGDGTDTFTMEGQTSDYDIDLGAGRVRLKGDPGGGTLSNFEDIIGGKGDDILSGDSGSNGISGGAGADDIYGKAGTDILSGEGGNDNIFGGGGRDIINGGKGADSLSGGGGNDKIVGGGGGDSLQGGSGRDKLIGGTGVDTLDGGAGRDTLKGGGGDDLLLGGQKSDILLGGSGNDRLAGGLGSDSLTGGAGADVFVFTNFAGEGADTITDYDDTQDRIDLQDFAFASFADVLSLTTQSGPNLHIDFGGGDLLVIENFLLADFDAADVIL